MKRTNININIDEKDIDLAKKKAKKYGFKNLSDYVRFVIINAELKVEFNKNDQK